MSQPSQPQYGRGTYGGYGGGGGGGVGGRQSHPPPQGSYYMPEPSQGEI